MIFDLKNKTAVITGGNSGIGLAISQVFSRQGASVHVLDLNTPDTESNPKDDPITYHICNISDQKAVREVFDQISSNEGLDILINNAGIAHVGNVEATEEKDLDALYQVNIKGVYNCIKAAVPYMSAKSKGVIINMASIASSVGISDRFAYSMTKGAVLAMTYSVAKDYISKRIRCNSISPARIHTPFVDGFIKNNYPGREAEMFDALSKTQPLGRMGTPEEVAHLALYLCSDEASFITGTDFPIDGGFIKLNG